MAYVPQWPATGSWNAVGRAEVAAADAGGWPEPVRRALEAAQRYGLPAEIDGMFCPSDRGAPFTRVTSASRPLWRLGRNDPLGGVEFVEEEDPAEAARVAFGMAVRDRLRQQDPDAYPEVGTWWARVYEEVEYDAI
ncbi:hypothetical protein ACIBF1_42090 [Spirillospora sp. NPDC050679]